MEKEINEKTMDFASEMYDFIERSEKKVTDFPAGFQAAAKAAVQMKRQFAIPEMAEIFDRWLAANPGDQPYVRLFDAVGIRPADEILNLGDRHDWPRDAGDYSEGPSAGWLDIFVDGRVAVNLPAADNERLKELYGAALDNLAERMSEDEWGNVDWEKIAGEYFDEVDTDDDDEDDGNHDSWNSIFRRIISGDDEDGDMDMAFSEYMDRFNGRNYRYDETIRNSVWVDVWAALGCQMTAYEFLTKYCDVKPIAR